MHHRLKGVSRGSECTWPQAEDAPGFFRPLRGAAGQVNFPTAQVGHPLRDGQVGLAAANRFLRLLALRDILDDADGPDVLALGIQERDGGI